MKKGILFTLLILFLYFWLNTFFHELWHYAFWKLIWFDWIIEVHKLFWFELKEWSEFNWVYKITDYWNWEQTNFQLVLMYFWWIIFEFIYFIILLFIWFKFLKNNKWNKYWELNWTFVIIFLFLSFSFSFYSNIIENRENDWKHIKELIFNDFNKFNS